MTLLDEALAAIAIAAEGSDHVVRREGDAIEVRLPEGDATDQHVPLRRIVEVRVDDARRTYTMLDREISLDVGGHTVGGFRGQASGGSVERTCGRRPDGSWGLVSATREEDPRAFAHGVIRDELGTLGLGERQPVPVSIAKGIVLGMLVSIPILLVGLLAASLGGWIP